MSRRSTARAIRRLTVFIAAMLLLSVGSLKAQNATDLFQQALELERAKGDLAGAMQIYQRIVSEFSAEKTVAANALFRLGSCQERIGQAQARASYERLVREYPDQTALADNARTRLSALAAAENAPRNPAITILEMDARTGAIHGPALRLTQGNAVAEQYPTWSPDGKSVAFKRTIVHGGQTSTSIVVRQLDAKTERTGSPQSEGGPFWLRDSATGDAGVLIAKRGNAIYRDTPDGRSQVLVNLGLEAHDVALSPDGKLLYALIITRNAVFVSSTVVAFDVATGQRKAAFALPAGKAAANDILDLGHYMSVSPDGSRLAIARWSAERQPHIERWGVDGKGYGELPAGPGLVRCLQWSKDGRSIFYAKSEDGVKWQIMNFGADGAIAFTGLEVTGLTYFDLNPDGSRIAFDGTSYAIRSPDSTTRR
jgi:Tol biopolymer transport system component